MDNVAPTNVLNKWFEEYFLQQEQDDGKFQGKNSLE